MKTIKVVLADDSPVAIAVLQRMLAVDPGIQVVGTAANGFEALGLVRNLKPDVLCTDFHMPRMNGLELTQQVMAENPLPVLVISVSVREDDQDKMFQLLEAGAIDVFPKPVHGLDPANSGLCRELVDKIRVLAGVTVFHRITPQLSSIVRGSRMMAKDRTGDRLLVIGASTGGPQELAVILSQLTENDPRHIICVQHISLGFLESLVSWLNRSCLLEVVVARHGERLQKGKVYFAPDDGHLLVEPEGLVRIDRSIAANGHCPSIDLTLHSVARSYGGQAVGVLLTGMGRDGAEGLLAIARAGGKTIVQDEESCVVFGMPRAAIELGAAQEVLPLKRIADILKGDFV